MTKSSENVFETKDQVKEFIAQKMEENANHVFYTKVRCDGRIIVEVYVQDN